MFRVGISTKDGQILSENFSTREKCDIYILEIDEQYGVKKAVIVNTNTEEREIINL